MHQQHLMLIGQEHAAIQSHIASGKSPRHAALLVRPDLKGKDFLQRGIHITLYGDLPDCQDDELAPIATDTPTQDVVVLVLAEETPAEVLPFVEDVIAPKVDLTQETVAKMCAVPSCERKHHAKELCKKHYRQVYEYKITSYEALMALVADN